MQIGAANSAGAHAQQNLTSGRNRLGQVDHLQGTTPNFLRRVQDNGSHPTIPARLSDFKIDLPCQLILAQEQNPRAGGDDAESQ
jgi:hypothetical protein